MLNHLAAPRVAAVKKFFKTTSDDDLLGCYAWCQAVSSGLLPILGDFEVSLRNSIHRALSQYYGQVDSFNWMATNPNPAAQANPNAPPLPALHSMNTRTKQDVEKAIKKVKSRKPAAYIVTPDDVVASLAFGFWEQTINTIDHHAHPPALAAIVLKSIFPYAPDQATCGHGDPQFKVRVVDLLSQLREVRNRIGHHDSIWGVAEFNEYGATGFIPRRPRHTVNSLKLLANRVAWLAGWMDPAISAYMQNSDHWWSYQSLLDEKALAVFRTNGGRVGSYAKVLQAHITPQENTAGSSPANSFHF